MLALVAAGAANAQSLKIRQIEQNQEEALVAGVEETNKACATVKFDWSAIAEADLEKYDAAGYCDNALSGIRRLCNDPAGQPRSTGKSRA